MVNEKLLIDVNQAIAEMNRVETNHTYDDKEDILEACINILHNASTVDAVEVVHGRWIVKGQDVFCSHCDKESGHNQWGASSFSAYCPNCGAKMDGRDNVPREA